MKGRNLQGLKEAAAPLLPSLVERAGFRPAKVKQKWHCCDHKDTNASCHLYGWGLSRFCCGDSLDAIDLAALAVGGNVGDGIRELERLTGISSANYVATRPRFTTEDLAQADQFRLALCWRIEEELASVKFEFFQGTGGSDRIRELTLALDSVQKFTPHQAAEAFTSLAEVDSALAADLLAEAEAMQSLVCNFIACLSMEASAVAA